MNAAGWGNAIWMLIVIIILAMVMRKVVSLPEKKLRPRAMYILFAAYLLLFLAAVPVSIFLASQQEPEILETTNDTVEQFSREIEVLIEDGDREQLLEGYRSQEITSVIESEELIIRSYLDGLPLYRIYIEETADLTEEAEIIHVYPRVVMDNIDMSDYHPEVNLSMSNSTLELSAGNETSVQSSGFTNEFVISQFNDEEDTGLFMSSWDGSSSAHVLWVRVPEGTTVETDTTGEAFNEEMHELN